MKPREAQLLILKHSGCSYAEIAAALRIAPGSVGTLLTRAEQVFEQRYRKEEEVEDAS
jgi:RNA polymerase sigma-70 factor (ECF subfamily)